MNYWTWNDGWKLEKEATPGTLPPMGDPAWMLPNILNAADIEALEAVVSLADYHFTAEDVNHLTCDDSCPHKFEAQKDMETILAVRKLIARAKGTK